MNAATQTFVPSAKYMEVRFLLPGEVFERKSVLYTAPFALLRMGDSVVLPRAIMELPDGTTREEDVTLPAHLMVSIQGRWLED